MNKKEELDVPPFCLVLWKNKKIGFGFFLVGDAVGVEDGVCVYLH